MSSSSSFTRRQSFWNVYDAGYYRPGRLEVTNKDRFLWHFHGEKKKRRWFCIRYFFLFCAIYRAPEKHSCVSISLCNNKYRSVIGCARLRAKNTNYKISTNFFVTHTFGMALDLYEYRGQDLIFEQKLYRIPTHSTLVCSKLVPTVLVEVVLLN